MIERAYQDAAETAATPIDVGIMPRMLAVGLSTIVLQNWVGLALAFGWAAWIVVWEFWVAKGLQGLLERHRVQEPDAYRVGLGSVFYASLWTYAWAVGEDATFFFAGVWFCGALIHSLVYLSTRPAVFIAAIVPPTAVVAVVPFLKVDWPIAIAMVVIGATAIATVVRGVQDRNRLLAAMIQAGSAKTIAERENAAKSQFLNTMTHELRTPISAVLGYAELIRDEAGALGRQEIVQDAQRIELAARHLLGLVNEVLDFAKIDANAMAIDQEPVDVRVLLEEVQAILHPLAQRNANTLRIEVIGAPPRFRGDLGRLRQCVLNLAGNACKFTEHGLVHIAAQIEGRGERPMLRIDVIDTGPGIAPEAAARLFRPFEQADPSSARRHGGAGLGLVITKRLAELMGGGVSLATQLGAGSTFTLRVAAPPLEGEHVEPGAVARAA